MFKNAQIDDFRHFILNASDRMNWDWSSLDLKILRTAEEKAELPSESESTFMFTECVHGVLVGCPECETLCARNKMPGIWCNREYVTARRVWGRPDGGCYSLTKTAPHPLAPPCKGRNVRVEDYASAFVLRYPSSVCHE